MYDSEGDSLSNRYRYRFDSVRVSSVSNVSIDSCIFEEQW